MSATTRFSDYILYVDESGTNVIAKIDKDYPILVLCAMLFKKEEYVHEVVPKVMDFKFKWFGTDQIILHEHEISKGKPPFEFLSDKTKRSKFMSDISEIISKSKFDLFSIIIDKRKPIRRFSEPPLPYNIALQFLLERVGKKLIRKYKQANKKVHVVFEKRGAKEDKELELEFRRVISGQGCMPNYNAEMLSSMDWEPQFVSKKSNSTGLQLADLCARPIGLGVLKPHQPNKSLDIIELKYKEPTDKKIYP